MAKSQRRVVMDKLSSSEVSPTQNREIMALRTLTTVDFFYFVMCEDPHE